MPAKDVARFLAFVAGAFGNNYDASLATIRGRFWYVQLKKRF